MEGRRIDRLPRGEYFTLHPKGFATAPNVGTPVAVPDFALPAARNDFTAGPFACLLKETKQTTDNTKAVFTCTLPTGKASAWWNPSRIGVKEPGGKEFANAEKSKRDVIFPGDTKIVVGVQIAKSVVDMQFATLQVLWRDALAESLLTPVNVTDWTLNVDPAKTEAANK